MGREEFKWHQLVHHHLWSQHGFHCSPHSTAKTNDKSTFLRKNGLLWYVSDVVITALHLETRLKKLMIMMMMMKKRKK